MARPASIFHFLTLLAILIIGITARPTTSPTEPGTDMQEMSGMTSESDPTMPDGFEAYMEEMEKVVEEAKQVRFNPSEICGGLVF